jgi:GntR family transcriptional repressor for pyruvate dehydrogenase complex
MADKTFPESIQPLGRKSLSLTIMNVITDDLLSGHLKPGDKLPAESELAQKLGVARNSVREAIKMLSSIGVVEIKRGIGTFIAKSMSDSMVNPLILGLVLEQEASKEIIEVRLLLDTGIAELAIQKATNEEIDALDQSNQRLKEAAEKNPRDPHELRDLDLSFHETLLGITKNPLLYKLSKAIYTLFLASIEKSVQADPLRAFRNHQMIIDAIRKRDAELVRKMTSESLAFWMQSIEPEKGVSV